MELLIKKCVVSRLIHILKSCRWKERNASPFLYPVARVPFTFWNTLKNIYIKQVYIPIHPTTLSIHLALTVPPCSPLGR